MPGFSVAYKLNLAAARHTIRMAVGKNDELFVVYMIQNKWYFAVWSNALQQWLIQKYLVSNYPTVPPYVVADRDGDLGGYILYYGKAADDNRNVSYSSGSEKGGLTLTRFSRTGTIIWERVYKRQFIGHPEVSPHYHEDADSHYVGLQPITWSRNRDKIYIASIFPSSLPEGDTNHIHRHLLAIDPESGDLLYDIGFDPLLSDNFTSFDGYYLSHVEASPYSNELIITGLARSTSNHLWWCRFEDDDSTFSLVPNGAGIFYPPSGYTSKTWHCLKPAYLPDGDIIFSTAPLDNQFIEYPEAFLFRKNLDNITDNRWGFSHFANRGETTIDDPMDQFEFLRVSARPDMFAINEDANKLILASANRNKRFPIYSDDGSFDFNNWEDYYAHAAMTQTILNLNPTITITPPYESTGNQGVSSQLDIVLGVGTNGNTLARSVFNLSQNIGFLSNGDAIYLVPHGYQDRIVPNVVIGGSWTRVNADKATYIDLTDDRIKFIRIDSTQSSYEANHNKVHHGFPQYYSDIQCPYVFKRIDVDTKDITFTAEQDYDRYANDVNQVYAGIMIKVPNDIRPDPTFVAIATDGLKRWFAYHVVDGWLMESDASTIEHFDRLKIQRNVNLDSPHEAYFSLLGLKILGDTYSWKTILTIGPSDFGNDLEFCIFAEPHVMQTIGQDAYVENINLYTYQPVEYDGLWTVTENVRNYLFHEYNTWTGSTVTPSIVNQDKWIAGNLHNTEWRGDVPLNESLIRVFYQPESPRDEGITIFSMTPECPGLIFAVISVFIPDTHVGDVSLGTIVLRNDNNRHIEIGNIEVTVGTEVFEFAGFDNWDQVWPLDAAIGLPIKFMPTEVETYTGQLTITNGCNKDQVFNISFEGNGIYSVETDLITGDSTIFGVDDIPELQVPDSLPIDVIYEIVVDQNNKAGIVRKKPIRTARFK